MVSLTPRDLYTCYLVVLYICTFAVTSSILLPQKLKRQSTKYRSDKIYPTATAECPENIKKNRYKDILPCRLEIASVTVQASLLCCARARGAQCHRRHTLTLLLLLLLLCLQMTTAEWSYP